MHREVLRHQNKIDYLFSKPATITDLEVLANWSKYLCVLSSGYIEESLRQILFSHCSVNASNSVNRYSVANIKRITNCKNSKIIDILRGFDDDWARQYEQEISRRSRIPNEIKDAIDSVIINRHRIAHGQDIGIGINTIQNYFNNVKIAIQVVDDIVPY